MYTECFERGEFKATALCPIREFVKTSLDVSFNDVNVFHSVADNEVVHIETALDFNNRIYF